MFVMFNIGIFFYYVIDGVVEFVYMFIFSGFDKVMI